MPNDIHLFNQKQLATWEQARETALVLSAGPIVVGGGVKKETADYTTSGIYLPSWVPGPGGFPEPNYTDPATGVKYYWLHYRFVNGMEGMNVGLVRDMFSRYPMSPLYVLSQLQREASEGAPH